MQEIGGYGRVEGRGVKGGKGGVERGRKGAVEGKVEGRGKASGGNDAWE